MEYIDLGLPSGNLWATCNVGANEFYEYGKYYNYQESLKIQTKEGILPSKEDFQELIKYCNWEYQNTEYKITGPNDNNIHLPITGYYDKSLRYATNEIGYYWSSTLNSFDNRYACCLHLDHNYHYVNWNAHRFKHTIRLIKKKNNMEKRKIEIDINTAKEWYNSNNKSLKLVALQAFSEQELKGFLPKTWKEYCNNEYRKGYYIDIESNIRFFSEDNDNIKLSPNYDKNRFETEKDAEAHLALMQLHVLRDTYRDYYQKGWKPDWNSDKEYKYCVVFYKQKADVTYQCYEERFLSFPTYKLAQQFLKNFRDLIEQAKDLI